MEKKKKLRVLISVYNKTGIVEFIKTLDSVFSLEIVSTGGTAEHLKKSGFKVQSVAEVSGFPEVLSGRVKTLHPKIFAGILANKRKSDHLRQLNKLSIKTFDLVIVNLYPFEETIKAPGCSFEDAIEQIDIGGVALLRAAAKNFESVIPVCEPADYKMISNELAEKEYLSFETRKFLARKVFELTSKYDKLIAKYLSPEE